MPRFGTTLEALDALRDWCVSRTPCITAPFVTLWTRTSPKLNKKDRDTKEPCPYSQGVLRLAQRYGQIGCSYESCKLNKLIRADMVPFDGGFSAEELWGGAGEHVPGSPYLVRHKERGTLYLAFRPRQLPSDGSIMLGDDIWLDARTRVEIPVPTGYLPPVREVEAGDQPWRTISLEGVVQIQCGEVWEIAAA